MKPLRVYTLNKCSTCRKAVRWLEEKGLPFEEVPIREQPPSRDELSRGLQSLGGIRKLLNTSSKDYRDLGIKDILDTMAPEAVFALIGENGNLAKRPFLVGDELVLAGFHPDEWEASLR
jgi:arsenate reductase